MRAGPDITPDPEHFGILYIKERYARELLDFQDACNQIVGRMVPGARTDADAILERIDRVLDPYGVLALTPRERQASNRFLSDEIKGLGVSAVIMPAIFLLVAALVLNVVMSRLAERQRTIIGTLKALGYGDWQVLRHFLGFGLVVGLLGGLGGIVVGVALAWGLVEMYKLFYQFPSFLFELYPRLFLLGMTISVACAVVGTGKGVWKILRLHPAEAMRPRPPGRGSAMFLERFPAIWRRLGFRTHIALRSLARNPGRTFTGVISCALAASIVLTALIMRDSIWFMVEFQFDYVSHSDVDIGMRDERSFAAVREAGFLPGVDYAEPLLGLVCDVRHGARARRMSITGLSPRHRLFTPMQRDLKPMAVPDDGLVVSRKLGEILAVRVGDRLELTPVRGRRETVAVPVRSVVDSFLGLECYADLGYLSRLVGEAEAVNSVQMLVDPLRLDDLYAALKQLPNAQGVSVRANAKANIQKTLIRSISFSLSVLVGFAGVIALGSMLNASLIEIADRTRDIASFRVLGYAPGPIASIFFRQSLVILLLGMGLALPISYTLVHVWASAYDTELFRLPIVIRPMTVVASGALMFAFVLASQAIVYRQIRTLDWLEGIKIKE
ncbi:MAG: ABC transporter permease [Phycisphaerae bacterium]|nr:ABC transporter permease [Phycisphaerae bacterium]